MNFQSIRSACFALLTLLMVAGCSTVDDGEGLQSALDVQPQSELEAKPYALTERQNGDLSSEPASPQQPSQINNYNDPGVDQETAANPVPITSSGLADPNTSTAVQASASNTSVASINTNPVDPNTGLARASNGLAGNSGLADNNSGSDFAASTTPLLPLQPRPSKTYLINGLASSVKAIGYGFTNLAKKIPNSELYNYASFIESSTVIRSNITKDIKAVYRANPDIDINMIGISFGANIVTLIAADLNRAGIPVNYLVTMDGPAMVPIRKNVRIVDNFTCSGFNCFRTKSRLAGSNRTTDYSTFKIASSHIPLANHAKVHGRILSQIRASRFRPVYAAAPQ